MKRRSYEAVITSLSLSSEVYIKVLPASVSHSGPDHVDDNLPDLGVGCSLLVKPHLAEYPQGRADGGGQLASTGLLLQICRQEGQLHRQPGGVQQ